MIRNIILIFGFLILTRPAMALSYSVYDHKTANPYILLQPSPGIFLGQMMRNIGLKPDWSNRQWIDLIHYANSDQVDGAGEILYHSSKLKVPLAALKPLKGYSRLENYFQPYTPPEPEPQVVVQPVAPPTPPPPPEPEPVHSGARLDFILGGGGESLSADNNVGNKTELFNEANALFKISFLGQLNENHQLGGSAMGQLKTYEAPASVGLTEDQTNLFEFRYFYGLRIFNNVYLNVVGQSKQFNLVSFTGTSINLETYFAHSAGLGTFIPLFYLGRKQISFYLDGQIIYADALDPSIDSGLFASAEIKIEPKAIEEGWLIGARVNYYDQAPSSYTEHFSIEGLGFVGYAF